MKQTVCFKTWHCSWNLEKLFFASGMVGWEWPQSHRSPQGRWSDRGLLLPVIITLSASGGSFCILFRPSCFISPSLTLSYIWLWIFINWMRHPIFLDPLIKQRLPVNLREVSYSSCHSQPNACLMACMCNSVSFIIIRLYFFFLGGTCFYVRYVVLWQSDCGHLYVCFSWWL